MENSRGRKSCHLFFQAIFGIFAFGDSSHPIMERSEIRYVVGTSPGILIAPLGAFVREPQTFDVRPSVHSVFGVRQGVVFSGV